MGRLSPSMSSAIKERWPSVLVEAVAANPKTASFVRHDDDRDPLDYRKSLDEAALSRYLEAHDFHTGLAAREWASNINRWLSRTKAPTPQMVRSFLAAVGADWIVGLGDCGYQQHAVCLIHALWKSGAHTRARAAAAAVFTSSIDDGFRAERVRLALQSGVASRHQNRLDAIVRSTWPESEGEIPTRAIAPADLAASPGLYSAWLVLEATRFSRSPATAWRFIKPEAANQVISWLDDPRGRLPTEGRL